MKKNLSEQLIHSSAFQDDGALHVTSVGHSTRHIAIGSDSGVVNVYNKDDVYKSRSKPLRAVMNLTTEIDRTEFNSTGELLAISSKVCTSACLLSLKYQK